MKHSVLAGTLLAVLSCAAYPQAKAPNRSQVCDEATRAYEVAMRNKKTDTVQSAKARVLKECFPVRARTSAPQKPVLMNSAPGAHAKGQHEALQGISA